MLSQPELAKKKESEVEAALKDSKKKKLTDSLLRSAGLERTIGNLKGKLA